MKKISKKNERIALKNKYCVKRITSLFKDIFDIYLLYL